MKGSKIVYSEHKNLQRSALAWVVDKVDRHDLPYMVVGGLAATAHGGSRPLHDIDLYAPFAHSNWSNFLTSISKYVVWGPQSVVDGQWDLTYLKIDYHGQRIEIGDCDDVLLKNGETGAWIRQRIDIEHSVSRSVLGRDVNVMPLQQLIEYKRVLGRDVDQQDIQELTGGPPFPQNRA